METKGNINSEYLRKRKNKMVEPENHDLLELDEDEDTEEFDKDTTPLISSTSNDNNSKKNKHDNRNGRLPHKSTDRDEDSDKITSLENENGSDTEVEIVDKSSESKPPDEGALMIALQVFIPYIIAGFGTVGAGMVLDVVQHWPVFTEISEVFILVPALLGLKGNLEMTLASRLSTQANLGKINCKKELWKMIFGNMALVQAQAIVVGFTASVAAMVMGWIPEGKFDLHHGLLLCASSIFTASIASLILGSIMVAVVILSKKCNINPDNVATPIAASLGDLITLSLLAFVSRLLYEALGKDVWLAPLIITIFLLLTPLWIYISVKNKYVNYVIYSGWVPILSAMLISSAGGLILDFTVKTFDGIAVFQPVINGVGGNLVAVQASRISTSLHRNSVPGVLPDNEKTCNNPFKVFCGKYSNAKAARALLSLVIPGQILFIYVISYMKAGHTSITLVFNVTYLTAAFLQVVLLLFIADWMVHLIWVKGEDPDNVAIPYLTAIGDLLGTAFLAIAFAFLFAIGDRDSDVGE